jgi:hypothetical protein
VSGEVGGDLPGGRRDGANLQDDIGSTLFQSFICSMADLMKRPKALSFFRLST